MSKITKCFRPIIAVLSSKTFRVSIIFVLTIFIGFIQIVHGIRSKSNSLIADGLYSFADGFCLVGVIIVLYYSRKVKHYEKNNTFGYERLELLFGLIQEVFLISVSLGITVDAIYHLISPIHVQDPVLLIVLGAVGMITGLLGMAMFWGYHHDHDIEDEITSRKKREFIAWTKTHVTPSHKSSTKSNEESQSLQIPRIDAQTNDKDIGPCDQTLDTDINTQEQEQQTSTLIDMFTYENVELAEPRVVFFESLIVVMSGLMIYFIPHEDQNTKKEINVWLKYIDPSLTLIMVIVIVVHALPVIISISEVLIESVPGGIDTENLMNEIVTAVPAIKSIHGFHVWRVTAKEIYAALHIVCNEDVLLSTCANEYGKQIEKIFRSHCIRFFTLQFEYIKSSQVDDLIFYPCIYGLHRRRRGHSTDEPMTKLAKNAMAHLQ